MSRDGFAKKEGRGIPRPFLSSDDPSRQNFSAAAMRPVLTVVVVPSTSAKRDNNLTS